MGVPHPISIWGIPCPRSRQGVPHPRSRRRVPHPADRVVLPSKNRIREVAQGTPPTGVSPQLRIGWGYPPPNHDWMEVPPSRTGGSIPLPPPIRRQISIARTCYTAGSVPLTFTQEDFLVLDLFSIMIPVIRSSS